MRPLFPIALNQLASVILGLAGVKLISEFVSAGIYGEYVLFLTLAQVGTLITYSGLINHTTRYWQRERATAGPYIRFLWSYAWRGCGYLAPLLMAISVVVSAREKDALWLALFPLLLVSNLSMALAYMATGALNADRSPWRVLGLTVASNAARVLAPIGFVLVFGASLFSLSTGFAVHGLLVIGLLALMFPAARTALAADSEQESQWKRELREYGRPFLLMGIGAWLLQFADRWIVQQFFGDVQAGLFAFASSLAGIIPTIVVGGLMQLIFPGIFRRADIARSADDWLQIARRCDQVTALFFGVCLAGLSALVLLGPYLVGSLISAKHQYSAALALLWPAGCAMMTVQVNQFYYLLLQGQHNSSGMVKVMIAIAGVKTVGSLVAAAVSWNTFLIWLVASLLLAGALGRFMIRQMALKHVSSLDTLDTKTEGL